MAKYSLEYDSDKLSDKVVALVKAGVKDTCKQSSDYAYWVEAFEKGLEAIHNMAIVCLEEENVKSENKKALNKLVEAYGDSMSLKEALNKLG